MGVSGWTGEVYAEELAAFEGRLRAYLDSGVGSARQLMDEAEVLFGLKKEFPGVFEKFSQIEGLVADLIARERQAEMFNVMKGQGRYEKPGCLLGWLFRRK